MEDGILKDLVIAAFSLAIGAFLANGHFKAWVKEIPSEVFKNPSEYHKVMMQIWLKALGVTIFWTLIIWGIATVPGSEDARGYIDYP